MTSVFEDFIEHSDRAGQSLAEQSDVMILCRFPMPGVGLWIAEFKVPYLAQRADGSIAVAPGPLVISIRFGPDYLRVVSPFEIVQVREWDLFHPNHRAPILCAGDVKPGMPLPQVVRHVYEIITYQNMATDDGLNLAACHRLRDEPQLLDLLDHLPLVRRTLQVVSEGESQ